MLYKAVCQPLPVRVLLLTDDTPLRDWVMAPALKQCGFEVTKGDRVMDMCEVLREGSLDIVLLDASLPDGDGFEVARRLRTKRDDIGIVIVSRRLKRTDLVRGLAEGADACLKKSVDSDVLVATLYSVARRLKSSTKTIVTM